MTFASKRFDNRLKRFRALMLALSIVLVVLDAQAQQTSIKDKAQSIPAKPTQIPSPSSGLRRIQAVRITDSLKIDGILDEPAWSLAQPATEFLQQQPTEGDWPRLCKMGFASDFHWSGLSLLSCNCSGDVSRIRKARSSYSSCSVTKHRAPHRNRGLYSYIYPLN